jgi:hypothetical protein
MTSVQLRRRVHWRQGSPKNSGPIGPLQYPSGDGSARAEQGGPVQLMSKRSLFITLVQALTKS